MIVTDAFWEKRNLGVKTAEIAVDVHDSPELIRQQVSALSPKLEYLALRVPAGNFQQMQAIESCGFHFIESSIHATHTLKNFTAANAVQKLCATCEGLLMDENDIAQMMEQIEKGIFRTDRVALDHAFSETQAARRYVGWTQDELARGSKPYKVLYQGAPVGFFCQREVRSGVYSGHLAGIYDTYTDSGFGYCVQQKALELAKQKGGKKVLGTVSSNNVAVLKVILSLGYTINQIEYIYIKHQSN